MIIDAHQHFWKVDRGDYGWLDSAPDILRRDYLPDDLKPQLDRFGVVKTIAVQAAPTLAETEYLLDLAERHEFIAGVIGWLDLEADDFAQELARLASNPKFLGLRPMLQDLDDDRWILRPKVLVALERLAGSGLCFEILTFPRHLTHVFTMLERVPSLRAVVDHLSKPPVATGELDPWREQFHRVAMFPNVYCKLSGLITEADHRRWTVRDLRPYVHHVVKCFTPDRVIWGSDWPVCRLAGEYGDVLVAAKLALPEALSVNPEIFGANAQKFYRLQR